MDTNIALQVLDKMRLKNGAYTASLSDDYYYVWIRDVVYTVIPYLQDSSNKYEKAYHALLDTLHKYEWKIDIHTEVKPQFPYEFIHSRYSQDLQEIDEEWGHAQNDAIGALLWGIGEGERHGKKIIRNDKDLDIVQKLVDYLECLQYWECPDNGMWEENMEIHASSIGACVAGLSSVKMFVHVKDELIKKGEESLRFLLPRESSTKTTDLALLSLIYPYCLVDRKIAIQILSDVSTRLERTFGVIRYEHDIYYNEGSEAEWCFGFPWLGLCYIEVGMYDKAKEYIEKCKKVTPKTFEIPELYIGGRNVPNGNTPLAWSVSLTYLFLERMKRISIEQVK